MARPRSNPTPFVKAVRGALKAAALPFPFWVRASDLGAWAGHAGSPTLPRHRDAIAAALTAAGFKCEFRGLPGTVGANIVDVVFSSDPT